MRTAILLWILIVPSLALAQQPLQFDHLKIPSGALRLLQDQQGFMWFANNMGPVRYDGYEFKTYYPNGNDSTAFQGGRITSMIEDYMGYLWMGTNTGGLYRFNPAIEKFRSYDPNPGDTTGLKRQGINTILEDSSHSLWVTTFGGGLNLYHWESDSFTNFFQETDSNSFWINDITHIFEPDPESLWLVTRGGLFHFNTSSFEFKTILNQNYPWHFYKDSQQRIWAAGPGINRFNANTHRYESIGADTKTQGFNTTPVIEIPNVGLFFNRWNAMGIYDFNGTVNLYYPEPNNSYSISPYGSKDAVIDRSGILWSVQNFWGDIDIYNPYKPVTHHINYLPDKESSDLSVWSMHIDDSSNVWIGTRNQGLLKYNSKTQKTSKYDFDSIPDLWINAIYQDRYGILWLGTMQQGLIKLDPNTGRWKQYERILWPFYESQRSLTLTAIGRIYEDSKNRLWVGSISNGQNLVLLNNEVGFEREVDSVYYFEYEITKERTISNYTIHAIHEDKFNNIWIGTELGLNRYAPATNDFTHFLMKRSVVSLFTDLEGQLWVGTKAGLFRAHGISDNQENDNVWFENIEVSEDLLGQPVFAIGEDDKGYLWCGSFGQRIIRYHPETKEYKVYEENDGVRIGNLRNGSFSSQGILGLCGSNGFITLNTNEVQSNPAIPPIVLTDFQISGKSITLRDSIDNEPILTKTINFTKAIKLPYGQNFTFKFAALDYANSPKNQYRYKLEGYDEDWSSSSTARTATYTNLWEGEYTFRVKGSNNDGVWNEKGTSIQITILPPWYRSKLAYGIYGGLFILALVFARKSVVRREREKARHQMEHMELERAKEMDSMKTQFFANISHEFRTPLTLILGPLKQMKEGTFKGDSDTVINVMIRNSKRLLHLINQLLDFSKLEAGAVGLQASVGDLVEFVRTMFASFETTAETRGIKYVFQSDVSSLPAYYDRDKLEKVIINLLSNAFKFVSKEGSIWLTMSNKVKNSEVDQGEGVIEIRIEDTGPGIDAEKLPHIFDRFYQADASSTRPQEGTGIGLALAKELVELHYGTIQATSRKGLGTTFIIHLPLGRVHLKDEEIVVRKGYQPIDTTALETLPEEANAPIKRTIENGELPLLLIVDDNEDMRLYLREVMSDDYHIAEASNGVQAWEYAEEYIPDLVISDVMMPEMDGYELCQKLKTDERTSHIPVVLLTARAGEQAKVEGLETGADDYITKPFSPVELKARVQNLIELRQKLREQFSKNLSLEPKDLAVTSADERFIERVMDIMEIHRSDPEFNTESFTKEIGLSRSQLHRKLKALTDQSAGEFIRSYRLKYARQLIEKEYGNMAQVAYESGFNNPSYFAECFKKQFGMLPSDFAKATK